MMNETIWVGIISIALEAFIAVIGQRKRTAAWKTACTVMAALVAIAAILSVAIMYMNKQDTQNAPSSVTFPSGPPSMFGSPPIQPSTTTPPSETQSTNPQTSNGTDGSRDISTQQDTSGSQTDRMPAVYSPPQDNAIQNSSPQPSVTRITGVVVTQIMPFDCDETSGKSVTVSWDNPHNPLITGWTITVSSLSGTGDRAGVIVAPGPNDSSQNVVLWDSTRYDCAFYSSGQTWQACVSPLLNGNSLGDSYTESLQGCSQSFTV